MLIWFHSPLNFSSIMNKIRAFFNKFKKTGRTKKSLVLPIALAVIVLVLLIFGVNSVSKNTESVQSNSTQVDVPQPQITKNVNKTFSFEVSDEAGTITKKFDYIVDSVDLQNQIIVKGQTATAIKDKTFLIVNLRLVNKNSQALEINARDYIRLSIEGDKEQFAPDIHSDPVAVQPISTKLTRVGFPIDSNTKKVILHVGEIEGDKQSIPVSF